MAKFTYSHSKTDSRGVLIAVYINLNICVKHTVKGNHGRVLILEAIVRTKQCGGIAN